MYCRKCFLSRSHLLLTTGTNKTHLDGTLIWMAYLSTDKENGTGAWKLLWPCIESPDLVLAQGCESSVSLRCQGREGISWQLLLLSAFSVTFLVSCSIAVDKNLKRNFDQLTINQVKEWKDGWEKGKERGWEGGRERGRGKETGRDREEGKLFWLKSPT